MKNLNKMISLFLKNLEKHYFNQNKSMVSDYTYDTIFLLNSSLKEAGASASILNKLYKEFLTIEDTDSTKEILFLIKKELEDKKKLQTILL